VRRTAAEAPQPRRLTDAEIREIAVAIRTAVRRPPPDTQRHAITSALHQLSDEDETRVEAALLEMLQSSPPERDAGGPGSTDDDGKRDDP
jgi:hypothetical protein